MEKIPYVNDVKVNAKQNGSIPRVESDGKKILQPVMRIRNGHQSFEDVWMLVCLTFVFCSLLELAIIGSKTSRVEVRFLSLVSRFEARNF